MTRTYGEPPIDDTLEAYARLAVRNLRVKYWQNWWWGW